MKDGTCHFAFGCKQLLYLCRKCLSAETLACPGCGGGVRRGAAWHYPHEKSAGQTIWHPNRAGHLADEAAVSRSRMRAAGLFIFDSKAYIEFCDLFQKDFGVDFPFSATLVLMEYDKASFSTERKIIFELEDSDKGIKSAGSLFLRIFQCAEKGDLPISIKELSRKLSSGDTRDTVLVAANGMLNFLGIVLEPIVKQCQKILSFRVR